MPSVLTLVEKEIDTLEPFSLSQVSPLTATGYGHTVIGTRNMNQDAFLVSPERGLFAVADGISGGLRGEDASRMAIEGLIRHATQPDLLKPSVEWAQHEILQEALASLGRPMMGTTLTAVQLHDHEITLCHVGDSRCYVMSEGKLHQISMDHRVYDEKQRQFVLSSYLGFPSDISPLLLQEISIPVSSGTRILLCTDGLHRQLPIDRVTAKVQSGQAPQEMVKELCDEAVQIVERSDNVTVVYIEIK